MNLQDVFRLLRPHQYIKNLFVFVPLFFAGQITQQQPFFHSFIAFLAFSCCASAIYILNDYKDIEEDRTHPRKKNRPLASGAISIRNGLILMGFLAFLGLALMAAFSLKAMVILVVYIVMNIAYSYRLKHVAILDISIIATGFILRIYIGSVVAGVFLSQWIVIMTFLLALFLALAKRRDDLLIFIDSKKKMRKVIDSYNLKFVESAMIIMASITIVSYIMYTTSADVVLRMHSNYVYLTSLYVLLGIMRYIQITLVENNSGSPTKIVLKDIFLQVTIVAWTIHFFLIIYF